MMTFNLPNAARYYDWNFLNYSQKNTDRYRESQEISKMTTALFPHISGSNLHQRKIKHSIPTIGGSVYSLEKDNCSQGSLFMSSAHFDSLQSNAGSVSDIEIFTNSDYDSLGINKNSKCVYAIISPKLSCVFMLFVYETSKGPNSCIVQFTPSDLNPVVLAKGIFAKFLIPDLLGRGIWYCSFDLKSGRNFVGLGNILSESINMHIPSGPFASISAWASGEDRFLGCVCDGETSAVFSITLSTEKKVTIVCVPNIEASNGDNDTGYFVVNKNSGSTVFSFSLLDGLINVVKFHYIRCMQVHRISIMSASTLLIGGEHNGVPIVKSLRINCSDQKVLENSLSNPSLSAWLGSINSSEKFVTIRTQSFITASHYYRYFPEENRSEDIIDQVQNRLHAEDLHCKLLYVTASDGEQIPVTVIFKGRLSPVRSRGIIINVYGAYGVSMSPRFSLHRIVPLRLGVIYVIAHVRGGGEKGKSWHSAGSGTHKKRGIEDFLEVCKWLRSEGLDGGHGICVEAGSAGALIVASAMNEMPSLFTFVTLSSPFVAPLQMLSDRESAFWSQETHELGDLSNRSSLDAVKSFDPILNVRDQPYPDLFVVCGRADQKCPIHYVIEWMTQLSEHSKSFSKNSLNLLLSYNGDHGGARSRDESRLIWSFQKAFVLHSLGFNHTLLSQLDVI